MRAINEGAHPRRGQAGDNRPRRFGQLIVDPDTGAVLADWPNVLPSYRSPCRPDRSKGIHQHRCSDAHASVVEGYRAWRESAETAAEAATNGYATELADYWRDNERPTFKAYLMGMKDTVQYR